MTFKHSFHIPENLAARCSLLFSWDEEYTLRAIQGYLQFMELKVNFEDWDADQLAPSNVIDMVWQQHLLYNKEYNQACRDFCGEIIGYDPDATLDHVGNEKRIERTTISLKALFGRGFDEDVWSFKGTINSEAQKIGRGGGRVTFNSNANDPEMKKEDPSSSKSKPPQLPMYPHSHSRDHHRDRDAPASSPAHPPVETRDEIVSDSEVSGMKLAASGSSIGQGQSPETVNVKIKCFLDGKTQDTCIRVKRTTKMKKVEDCLARLMNLESAESIRFLVDGEQVSPWETLQTMKVEDPDQHWFTVMPKVQ